MPASTRVHVEGRWPWFANLAEVMDESPGRLDELAGAFRGDDDLLDVERFIATGIPGAVIPDRFPAEGGGSIPFREALWLLFVQGYWSGVATQDQFKTFGIARGADELGVAEPRELAAAEVAPIADLLRPVHAALAGGPADRAEALDGLLRLEIQWGVIFGIAYTVGFYVPTLQPPPAGAKPDHITVDPKLVVCSRDRLLDIEYRDPVPAWLAAGKDRHAAAAAAHPDRWEAVVAGHGDQADLRGLWQRGFDQCIYNWGADSLAGWSQGPFEQMLYWNLQFGFPVEAVAHEAITALTTGDDAAIRGALEAAALLVPMWLGTSIGIGDQNGTRPRNSNGSHFVV